MGVLLSSKWQRFVGKFPLYIYGITPSNDCAIASQGKLSQEFVNIFKDPFFFGTDAAFGTDTDEPRSWHEIKE